MQALIQLPAPCSTLNSMHNFHDKMETYIRGLESLGQHQDGYGTLLVPVILDKMPSEVRKSLAREHGDLNWPLGDLRQALDQELNIMEAGSACNIPEMTEFVSTASFYAGSSKPNDQRQRHQKVSQNSISYDVQCVFCGGNHKHKDCVSVPDMKSRYEQVKQKRLCFNCLGLHQVSKCPSRKRCQVCTKKHHTSICSNMNTQEHSQEPEVLPTRPETTVLHSSSQRHKQGVLLKTAISTVYSGQIHTDACILFDEGAQNSFITEALARELEVNRNGTETIRLAAFGDKKDRILHLETATIDLISDRKERIPINVLIVPTIATPISTRLQHTAARLPYLSKLKLAHPVTERDDFHISLLIGADHYWDIIKGEVIRGKGPTAMKSKIGSLLSGPVGADKQVRITSST